MTDKPTVTDKPPEPKKRRGRPPKAVPKLGASPEQAARAMFSAVEPPDPSRRIPKRKRAAAS